MKFLSLKKDGRITQRTRDDFLCWVKKKNALKQQTAEQQLMQAKALATWADDGGQLPIIPQNHLNQVDKK